jgi:putative transcriptional regulator
MGIRHRLLDFVTDDLTLYAIARDAGISTNTIYKLSADPAASMSWVVLAKLCQVLKCQPGDLLSYDPDGGEG